MSEPSPQAGPMPTPIPMTEEFPVHWDDPFAAQLLWSRDRMHFPEAIAPAMELFMEAHNAGFMHAFSLFEMPIEGLALRRVNGYAYNAIVPRRLPPDEMAAMGERAQRNLGAAVPRAADRWAKEQLPEVQELLRFWQEFDLAGATMDGLVTHAKETRRRLRRLWEIHFELIPPVLLGMSLFQETYADLFGADQTFEALALLQGFGNKTTEINSELWRLAQTAGAEVREVILTSDPATVVGALRGSDAGRTFLEGFDSYLQAYGRRSETWEFTNPSWLEDATPVWRMLREHLVDGALDPNAELARLAQQREAALTDVRAKLAGYPQPVIEHFEGMLLAAQQATVLSEDHGFYIDFEGAYHIRQLLLEFGRRFTAAGVLASADDVMMLTLDETLATAEALPELDRRALAAERHMELQHFAEIDEPEMLGSLPPGPPPDDPVGRAIGRLFGTPPQASADPDVLNGHAGSPGVVRGVARVARTLAEAQDIARGEILVAPMTAPTWTPLFGTVAAVVTDTGGMLSHSAVVAREYGIPAVVGTLRATSMIRDGQVIEVDGRAGTVRLVQRSPSPA